MKKKRQYNIGDIIRINNTKTIGTIIDLDEEYSEEVFHIKWNDEDRGRYTARSIGDLILSKTMIHYKVI